MGFPERIIQGIVAFVVSIILNKFIVDKLFDSSEKNAYNINSETRRFCLNDMK